MEKENKLKEIIIYAVKNGYPESWVEGEGEDLYILSHGEIDGWHYRLMLLDKDFAKAVFGEKQKNWVYCLQQAVIAEDVIDYYYQFIIENEKENK